MSEIITLFSFGFIGNIQNSKILALSCKEQQGSGLQILLDQLAMLWDVQNGLDEGVPCDTILAKRSVLDDTIK